MKEKKNPWCKSGFPLVLSALSNFEFFYAFIILEILTGHKKKYFVNFLHVHRRNLVKEKTKMREVEVGFHCFSCAYFFNAQFFFFPGRATDTAVPIQTSPGSYFSEAQILAKVQIIARFFF